MLNKPRGVVSTMDDPEGRRTLADCWWQGAGPALGQDRLFHVGRLDTETEGLFILTNDGDFAHRLAHPSFEVPKTYLAEVDGGGRAGHAGPAASGVTLEDGPVRPVAVKLVSTTGEKTHWSRSRCMRVVTMSCAVRWKRSAIRFGGCRGPGSDRCGWERSRTGEFRELTRDELGGCST